MVSENRKVATELHAMVAEAPYGMLLRSRHRTTAPFLFEGTDLHSERSINGKHPAKTTTPRRLPLLSCGASWLLLFADSKNRTKICGSQSGRAAAPCRSNRNRHRLPALSFVRQTSGCICAPSSARSANDKQKPPFSSCSQHSGLCGQAK